MNDLKLQLEELVETSLGACQSWLMEDSQGGLRLRDPVDKKTVQSHYGDSHLAAALIILGKMRNDAGLINRGVRVIETVIRDWEVSVKFKDFHHDFNNFALCLIDEHIKHVYTDISQNIRALVLSTRDSNHDTINWLPMRAYVNRSRFDWVNENRYLEVAERSLKMIQKATNDDGGIEDRLPADSSYNLQYNVSSLAALQLLSRQWPTSGLDLAQSLHFLLERILPDGDINYVGRGTNQIFAWGAWLYVLASAEKYEELKSALNFLAKRYQQASKNNNILLNEFVGREKSFWWDYHFCSVYHAHFLLWSVLALKDYGRVKAVEGAKSDDSTGLTFTRGNFGGAAVFKGRNTYLAEAGPALCALWISDRGMLFKGGLGPWRGLFGKKYSFADAVFQNHFGLISQNITRSRTENRLYRRLIRNASEDRGAVIYPVFSDIRIKFGQDSVNVIFQTKGETGYLNVPIFEEQADDIEIELAVDGETLESVLVGKFKNQYGWNNVTRSRMAHGWRWEITIR